MLAEYYKSPWRRLAIQGRPTVGELVASAPGAVSLGFTLGTAAALGFSRFGGLTASCAAWGSAATAAVKLEVREGRVWALLAKGVAENLPQPLGQRVIPGTPAQIIPGIERKFRSILVPLGSQRNAPTGQIRGGSVQNPFADQANLRIHGGVDDYVTINGRRVGTATGGVSMVDERMVVEAGAAVRYALFNPTGGFAGGDLAFEFTVPGAPSTVVPGTPSQTLPAENPLDVAERNASAAIPYLETGLGAGEAFAWFPTGEAFAMAGNWMRRASWADAARRMRFERGAGSADSVAVALDTARTVPSAQLATDFGLAEFLGEDWTFYAPPTEDVFIDVTNFRFEALLGGGAGFFFAVEHGPDDPPPPPDDPPPPPPEPPLPATGDFVRMVRNGVELWAPVAPFACPLDD